MTDEEILKAVLSDPDTFIPDAAWFKEARVIMPSRAERSDPPPHEKALLGTWRQFGETGPVYQIIGVGEPRDNTRTMLIRVIESGEELNYNINDLLEDPKVS